jgi:hypothetical protein
LQSNVGNFEVYNLSIGADTPKERIVSLNNIIESKPEIIVYGIGYRDFRNQEHDARARFVEKNFPTQPEISDNEYSFQSIYKYFQFELNADLIHLQKIFSNPKHSFLNLIKTNTENQITNSIKYLLC